MGWIFLLLFHSKKRWIHRYYLEIMHNVQNQFLTQGHQVYLPTPQLLFGEEVYFLLFSAHVAMVAAYRQRIQIKKNIKKTSSLEWAIVKWYNRPLSSSRYCTKYKYQMNITLDKCWPMKSTLAECARNSSLPYTVSVYESRK